jgi:hypothetical protein
MVKVRHEAVRYVEMEDKNSAQHTLLRVTEQEIGGLIKP